MAFWADADVSCSRKIHTKLRGALNLVINIVQDLQSRISGLGQHGADDLGAFRSRLKSWPVAVENGKHKGQVP
jgi:hypothetical protein